MSAKSIFSNKARSALTMLGIIIGLAAVIVLVSYAQGQNMAMQRYYESMGTNKISVSAYDWTGGTDISQSLYDYCLNLSDQVVGFSPTGTVSSAPPIKFGSKTLAQDTNGGGAIIMGGGMAVSGDRGSNYPTLYLGNNQFGQCNDYTIAKGRDLSYLDVKNSSKVCVLGAATADYLFNFANPIDQIITISGTPFRVVGVYDYKGDRSSSSSGTEDDQWINEMISGMDKMILLPSTMNRIFNNNEPISDYVVKVRSAEDLRPVITGLKGFLTVTERTREIGIRKAIGAERRSIIVQFLIEAAMICGIGGLFGIGVGYIGTLIVGKLSFNTILIPSPGVTLGAAAISVALGIIFGMYPAIKASGLQPVVALRAD